MTAEISAGRVRWQCHRGMLELDLLLEKFFDHEFSKLTDEEKKVFVTLLNYPDPVLYDWLLGHAIPDNPDDLMMVNKIRHPTA